MRRTLRLARYWFSVMRRRPWLKTLFEHTFPRLFGEKKSHANKLCKHTYTPREQLCNRYCSNKHTHTRRGECYMFILLHYI
jgi:hypothetical protein